MRIFRLKEVVCGGAALLGLVLVWSPGGRALEERVSDFLQRGVYAWRGPEIARELFLVAIDDRSVDPAYSPYADLWGRGGWITRTHWNFQLAFHKDFFKPRVLAYDILFLPTEAHAMQGAAADLAAVMGLADAGRLQALRSVEEEGNNELEGRLWDLAAAREEGKSGTRAVFAYYFPGSEATVRRLLERGRKGQEEGLEALQRMVLPEGVVAGMEGGGFRAVQLPMPSVARGPVLLGAINAEPSQGGVIRRVPLASVYTGMDGQRRLLPGLALASLLAYWGIEPADLKPLGSGVPGMKLEAGGWLELEPVAGRRYRVPVDGECRLAVRSRFRYKDVPSSPYCEVTAAGVALLAAGSRAGPGERFVEDYRRAKLLEQQLAGKIVFIGQGFTGSGDIGNFPLEEQVPNVMAQLTAVDNILRGDGLWVMPGWAGAAVCVLAAAAAWWVWTRRGAWVSSCVLGGAALMYPLVVTVLFVWGGVLGDWLGGLCVVSVCFMARTLAAYREEAAQRQEVRRLFSAAVAPEVLEALEDRPEEVFEGRRTEATVFFSDVAGFTAIAERMPPGDLSRLLNRYLTPMSDLVLEERGYLDKYVGDAIMAVWGVLSSREDHARRACRCALRQLEGLRSLAEEIARESGVRIDIRVGINSGEVSAGMMGCGRKIQYTVMGDTVNLAARLEPANKDYGTRIMVGSGTRALAEGAGELRFRRLDRIVVKGKSQPAEIHELLGPAEAGEWIGQYERGLEAYFRQDWDGAERWFAEVLRLRPGDGPARRMQQRVLQFRALPPGPDWNGAWARQAKD